MKVQKIVLTGGPISGKTSIVNMVKDHFKKYLSKDFELIVANEENYNTNEVDLKSNKRYVILYDRTLIDSKEKNISEIEILDNYDLVVDIISTTNSDSFKYSHFFKDLNMDIEEVKLRDKEIAYSYMMHHNIKLIKSDQYLRSAFLEALNYIVKLIYNEQDKIISRKEIDLENSDLSIYSDDNSRTLDITDYKFSDGRTISKRTYKGNVSYVFTKEHKIFNCIEYKTSKITEAEFNEFQEENDILYTVNRKELTFIENNTIFRINILDNQSYIEYEMVDYLEYVDLPKNIKVKSKNKILEKKK